MQQMCTQAISTTFGTALPLSNNHLPQNFIAVRDFFLNWYLCMLVCVHACLEKSLLILGNP